MGQTPDEIESRIEGKREDLRSNLEELEDRVKSVTDWRRQFRRNPAVALGLAFGGGLLLASMVGRSGSRSARIYRPADVATRHSDRGKKLIVHAWDNIQSALIGVVAAKVSNALAQVVSGFRDQLPGSEGAGDRAATKAADPGVQGEGDYRAARRYRSAAEKFAHTADLGRAARNAAPRNEAEAEDMAQAEAKGRARAKP